MNIILALLMVISFSVNAMNPEKKIISCSEEFRESNNCKESSSLFQHYNSSIGTITVHFIKESIIGYYKTPHVDTYLMKQISPSQNRAEPFSIKSTGTYNTMNPTMYNTTLDPDLEKQLNLAIDQFVKEFGDQIKIKFESSQQTQ